MSRRLVLATHNAKKLTELRRVVVGAGLDLEVLGLSDVSAYPEPVETERTFQGNALLKARAAVAATGIDAVADDSGICVDELGGMPGVRSARWAGPEGDDQANNQLLLRQLHGVPAERRTAQFVCVVALVTADGAEQTFRGEMPGRVADELEGEHGFGYDPLFIPDGEQRTTAQLSPEEKDAISHRGQAVRALVEHLKEA